LNSRNKRVESLPGILISLRAAIKDNGHPAPSALSRLHEGLPEMLDVHHQTSGIDDALGYAERKQPITQQGNLMQSVSFIRKYMPVDWVQNSR
jgi:hypothetical protein